MGGSISGSTCDFMYKCQRRSAIVVTSFGRVGQYKLRMNRYKASLIEFGITRESSPSLRNAKKHHMDSL